MLCMPQYYLHSQVVTCVAPHCLGPRAEWLENKWKATNGNKAQNAVTQEAYTTQRPIVVEIIRKMGWAWTLGATPADTTFTRGQLDTTSARGGQQSILMMHRAAAAAGTPFAPPGQGGASAL